MLVDYRWDLALGDAQLTKSELDALAAAKVPLVNIRGQWVHVDQKRLAAGLAFLNRSGSGQMSADEALRHAASYSDTEALPMPVSGVGGTGWLADLLTGGVEADLEPVSPPPGFRAELRPYQRRGLAWLAFLDRLGLGGCLADDMGLGKTVQLLALEALRRAEGTRPPTLLVCPMSLVGNWQREAAKFAPDLSVHVHHGAEPALRRRADRPRRRPRPGAHHLRGARPGPGRPGRDHLGPGRARRGAERQERRVPRRRRRRADCPPGTGSR